MSKQRLIPFALLIFYTVLFAQNNMPTFSEVPVYVKSFLNNSVESPFGQLNTLAPREVEHWGKLSGVWFCKEIINSNDEWVEASSAFWVFKYTLDGFAVEDLWFQKFEDLDSASQKQIGHDYAGINFRVYDPHEKKWTALWMTNGISADNPNRMVTTFEAVSTEKEIVMTNTALTEDVRVKIIFYNITDSHFDWKRDISRDGGKTWNTQFKIAGRKIK